MSEADFCSMDAGEYYATKGFLDRERFYRKQEMEEQMKNRVTVRHGMLSDLKTYLKQSGWKLEEPVGAYVVSCDEGHRYSETVQVAFCTTQPKSNLPTHVEILSTGRASTVMCEQINTVSLERLGNYIGRCTAEEMRDIDIAVATALGLKKYPGLIERLKEREQQVEKREAVVSKETDTKAALELATVKAERDTYRRLYEDLIRGFIPTAPAGA